MIELVLVLQQLVASSMHLVAKDIIDVIHPSSVVLWRGVFAVLLSFSFLAYKRKTLKRVERSDWKKFLLLGVTNLPINQLLFIWGLKYTTPANSALAYALTPAFVVVLQRIVYGEKPSFRKWLGIGIAFAGAAIVLFDRDASMSSEYMLGNCMVLGASASWAVFTIISGKLASKYGGFHTTALSMVTGLATYIPVWTAIVLFLDTTTLDDTKFLLTSGSFKNWAQLFYMGVINSALGYGLWIYALARMDSARVAVFNNLQPIITTIMAMIIYDLTPSAYLIAGGVLILIGVVVTQRSR